MVLGPMKIFSWRVNARRTSLSLTKGVTLIFVGRLWRSEVRLGPRQGGARAAEMAAADGFRGCGGIGRDSGRIAAEHSTGDFCRDLEGEGLGDCGGMRRLVRLARVAAVS